MKIKLSPYNRGIDGTNNSLDADDVTPIETESIGTNPDLHSDSEASINEDSWFDYPNKKTRRKYLENHSRNYVSNAPLHVAWPYCKNIPPEKRLELESQGYDIKRGRFTPKEDKRIRKNWRRLIRLFPQFNDPVAVFYNIKRDSDSQQLELYPYFTKESGARFKQNFRYSDGYLRLAYKLDNRLVCDIYYRCKKLIANESFKYKTNGEISRKKRKKVLKEIVKNQKPVELTSCQTNISPAALYTLKRYKLPGKTAKRHFFKPEEDHLLGSIIADQFEDVDPESIPVYKINWKKVADEFAKHNINLGEDQLARRWRKLNPAMVGMKFKSWDQIKDTIRAHYNSINKKKQERCLS